MASITRMSQDTIKTKHNIRFLTRRFRKEKKMVRSKITLERQKATCVPLETGRRIAPAPATFALALAMDGSREPKAEAER